MPTRRNNGHARMKRESNHGNAPDPLRALQQQLTRQLQQTVEDTVDSLCDDYQHELRQMQACAARTSAVAARTAAPTVGAASTADYEMYYSCCKRLVAYITANMTTSPDFAAQMDRIILACHSKAPEHVLRTVATKNVWFHRRDGSSATTANDSEPVSDDDAPRALRATAATKRMPKAERVSPARSTRAQRKRVEAPTRTAAAKRRSLATAASPPVAKRQRPTRRSLPLPEYDDDDEEEDDDDEEEEVVEVDDSDDDDESAVNQPHLDVSDELLAFKDNVRDLCYVDKRTPAQTKFFKDRLRKAILFVDAQLCKPPPGHVCCMDCKKLRSVMCDRTLPCRNKVCRVWHDVEVHIDQCTNPHCELKSRIMLRETMHKIDHKRLQIASARREVAGKTRERDALIADAVGGVADREALVDHTLVTSELEQLEAEITAAEEELGILTGTKKAFWASLNVVGIELKDDVADGFPDLADHYAPKKLPAPKRAAKDIAAQQQAAALVASPGGAHEAVGAAETVHAERTDDPMAPITRRTARCSTAKTFQAMAMDGGSVDNDDAESVESAESVEVVDQVAATAAIAPVADDEAAAASVVVAKPVTVTAVADAMDSASYEQSLPETQDLNDLNSSEALTQPIESQVVGVADEPRTAMPVTIAPPPPAVGNISVSASSAETAPFTEPLASPVNNIEILPSIGVASRNNVESSSI